MNEKEKELLAQFHHTISEQLNSRLSESPKFFGLLVIVSSGYGLVLANKELAQFKPVVTALSLAATLWASWYLAALGYAFRFLQNIQHRIEHKLEWSPFAPESGKPTGSLWNPLNWFWLLPGIYHPHAAALAFVFVLVCITGIGGPKRFIVLAVGVLGIALVNFLYLKKFESKTKLKEPLALSHPQS
jgi:hypothetical protein